MAWNPIDHPVDHVDVLGKPSPGHAEVGGAALKRKWDERGGIGIEGSTIVLTKIPLVPFEVRIRLYTPEDFAAWDAWSLPLKQVPNPFRPRALDIYHPILAELKIRAVVVETISQFNQVEPGVWEVVISFMTYRKRKPLPLMKPEGAEAPKPADPFDQIIANNAAQIGGNNTRIRGMVNRIAAGQPVNGAP